MYRRMHDTQPLDYYIEPEDNLINEDTEESFEEFSDYLLMDLVDDDYLKEVTS